MDEGTRLVLLAVLRGLRRSGQVSNHGISVIVDELRYAARDAREMLFDAEAQQILLLAEEIGRRDEIGVEPVPSQITPFRRADLNRC